MRWIPFIIMAYAVLLVQSTFGGLLAITFRSVGAVGPDMAAALAVFAALYVRSSLDAMIAGWVLGFFVDLLAGGPTGVLSPVGPMSMSYALASGVAFGLRDAFFRERPSARFMLTLVFCLIAHGTWVTVQTILASSVMTWGDYGRMLLQAGLLSAYSALLAPVLCVLFDRTRGLLIIAPSGRGRRYR